MSTGSPSPAVEPRMGLRRTHDGSRRAGLTQELKALALDGRVGSTVVIVGGLLTLQSSDNLNLPKITYLLMAAAALLAAIVGLRHWLESPRIQVAGPWLAASSAFAALLVLSFLVSRVHNTSLSSWLRDAAAYALFGAAPVIGLACARSASRRWIVAALSICGALASVSFTVVWVERRNILTLPIDRIVLPTGALGSALLALATAFALAGVWQRRWWAVAAGTVLGLFFISGSRSTLLLLAVPLGAALLARRSWGQSARTVALEAMVAVALFASADLGVAVSTGSFSINLPQPGGPAATAAAPGASAEPSAPATPATNRFVNRLSDTGSLLTDPGSDQSFQQRWTQTQTAWQAFLASPLVGVGPGYSFVWQRTQSVVVSAYTMDTPLIYLAKFGLLGLIPLALFVAAYARLILATWRRPGSEIEFLALSGFAIVLMLTSVLGSPIEDKGVSFATILLVAFGCRTLVRSEGDSAEPVSLTSDPERRPVRPLSRPRANEQPQRASDYHIADSQADRTLGSRVIPSGPESSKHDGNVISARRAAIEPVLERPQTRYGAARPIP